MNQSHFLSLRTKKLPDQEIKKGQEVSEESRVFSAFKS